jgi:integrase/recombinase XerD
LAKYINNDLDKMAEGDYRGLVERLEREHKQDFNYRKFIKSFYNWHTDGNLPKWIKGIRLVVKDTPVQPSDLLTKQELDRILDSCTNPRDKALIAVALDSAMRIGAIGTLRIKNVAFNKHGAVLYMSTTSRNQKTTSPQPIPLTWSTGFLNAWLDIHPDKNDPEAPVWVSLHGNTKGEALSYRTMTKHLKIIVEASGVKNKHIHFHLFKHHKVTDMILRGFSEPKIKYQAGWKPDSNRMMKIYGNFLDKDMVDSIYAQYGLKPEDGKQVTLDKCPRCHTVLVPEARLCHQCALVLDAGLDKELKVGEDNAQKALLKMMESPEVTAMLKEMMNK